MSSRSNLLESISTIIKDYRAGEIDEPTAGHVDKWVCQFNTEVQLPLLAELDHVLKNTYFNQQTVFDFIGGLITNRKLAGADPCAFWKTVGLLNIQNGGNSQREMLAIFDEQLRNHCGFNIQACDPNANTFVYLDDVLFTGNRVLNDLRDWLPTIAVQEISVHVVTIAFHRGGQYYAATKLNEAAAAAKKEIKITWWRCLELEDRKCAINTSDVLRPRSLPTDRLVAAYVAALKYPPALRTQDSVGENEFFSSEAGRHLLEQVFLKAGLEIRNQCPFLSNYQRPLGNMVLETLGFGTTIVTFRNCPNNAPLAFWAGDPWYPLFARKIN